MPLLRRLFGPSKAEIWQQLSQEIGGDYQPGGLWQGGKVVAQHGQWTITLDTHTASTRRSSVIYTRMRAPFVNQDGFRFAIYRTGPLSDVGKWLGMQDVELGYPEFDQDFVIQGNDQRKLRELLSDADLRKRIEAQPSIHLAVQDDQGWFGSFFPDGVDELSFQVAGLITDVQRLKGLYDLFAAVLDGLCRIGSAYEGSPNGDV